MKPKSPQHEKKIVYSIRTLKNGTGSVLIGASFILLALATPHVAADENLSRTNENISAVTANPVETDSSQDKDKSPISEKIDANDSLNVAEKSQAVEATPSSESPKTDKTGATPPSNEKKSGAGCKSSVR